MERKQNRDLEADAKTVQRYATLCNLIEAIWIKRNDEDYYNVDLEDLPPLTSPQARRIATFIEELFEVSSSPQEFVEVPSTATPEQRKAIETWNGGRCLICGKMMANWGTGSNDACVDCDPESGKPLGIICGACKRKLDSFHHDPQLMRWTAEVIEEWERRAASSPPLDLSSRFDPKAFAAHMRELRERDKKAKAGR
jgi:Recombination endonuclease VII